jgi:hypothetical protein
VINEKINLNRLLTRLFKRGKVQVLEEIWFYVNETMRLVFRATEANACDKKVNETVRLV